VSVCGDRTEGHEGAQNQRVTQRFLHTRADFHGQAELPRNFT
jgi:hypothetical protein